MPTRHLIRAYWQLAPFDASGDGDEGVEVVVGESMRRDIAVKQSWNKDGEFVDIRIPPPGDPIWKELHALQEKAAGRPVPYSEELKVWEGPAASQVYQRKLPDGTWEPDDWVLSGGGEQLFLDRDQVRLLKDRGFMSPRQKTNFDDFDPQVGNIVPKDGIALEIIPDGRAVPW